MRLKHSQLSATRRGYTLVEVLIAIAIISVLIGLTFVGVQAARESARRASCQSNLRQIGLGLLNYESTHGVFPYGHSRQGFSAHVHILPFVGEQVRFDSFNIGASAIAKDNELLEKTSPAIYSCPNGKNSAQWVTNYFGNGGTGFYDGSNGGLISWRDPRSHKMNGNLSVAAIVDGTSNTVLASETLNGESDLFRSFVNVYYPRRAFDQSSFAGFARQCFRRSGQSTAVPESNSWIHGDPGYSRYFHILGPNRPCCSNGGAIPELIYSAGSLHPRGVNSLFADGAVTFLSDGIADRTWREIGSRDGSESVLSLD